MNVGSASVDFLVFYPDKMNFVQSTVLAVFEKVLLVPDAMWIWSYFPP